MIVPEAAIEMCKRFEGLRLVRYICPAGFPTVGYGHRCAVDQGPITKARADELLVSDLSDSCRQAVACCPSLETEPDSRRAAIADFVFNLGISRFKSSTFRRRLAEGDYRAAAAECKKWIWGGGRKLPGLILRREAEAALLLQG